MFTIGKPDLIVFEKCIISCTDQSHPQTQMVLTLSYCAANKKNSAQVIVQNANVAAFHTKARPLSEPFKCCQEAERAKRSCSHSQRHNRLERLELSDVTPSGLTRDTSCVSVHTGGDGSRSNSNAVRHYFLC